MLNLLIWYIPLLSASEPSGIYAVSPVDNLKVKVHLTEYWRVEKVSKTQVPKTLQVIGSAGVGTAKLVRLERRVEQEIPLWFGLYSLTKSVGVQTAALATQRKVKNVKAIEFVPVKKEESEKSIRKAIEALTPQDNGNGEKRVPFRLGKVENVEKVLNWNGQPVSSLSNCRSSIAEEVVQIDCSSTENPYNYRGFLYRNVSAVCDQTCAELPKTIYQFNLAGKPAYLFSICSDGHGCELLLWHETSSGEVQVSRGTWNQVVL